MKLPRDIKQIKYNEITDDDEVIILKKGKQYKILGYGYNERTIRDNKTGNIIDQQQWEDIAIEVDDKVYFICQNQLKENK